MIKRTIHFSIPCSLKLLNEQLVVSQSYLKGLEDIPDKTVPIEDIAFIVLEHKQISISHSAIAKLIEHNVALITCNDTQMPTGMMLSLNGNTVQAERFKTQLDASEPLKKQLWAYTVKCKIENQQQVLDFWNIPSIKLKQLASAVKSGDTDNCEAQAAAYYWAHLFPPAWNFTRHREGAAPNNLLNYGYAILRATVARALVGSGLLPTFGIFHKNRYNAYALADDIMEPYRPVVDHLVRSIVYQTSHIEILTKELKAQLLSIPTLDVKIDGERSPLMIAVSRTTASLVKCYEGVQRKILFPELLCKKD